MVISRSLTAAKLTNYAAKSLLVLNARNSVWKQITRGKYSYRKPVESNPTAFKVGAGISAMFWWWMTWHYLTDFHELLTPTPADPSKWTDEELGIPPDDAD